MSTVYFFVSVWLVNVTCALSFTLFSSSESVSLVSLVVMTIVSAGLIKI